MSKGLSTITDWLAPLLFIGCGSIVVWGGPDYLVSWGWADETIAERYPPATPVQYIALVALPFVFAWGVSTIRLAKMEHMSSFGFDRVSLFLGRVTMMLVMVLVLVMFYEVISRYVFATGTLWANELSLWMAGFIFMFAGLYAMQQRSHIRIFIIYDLFPRWLQKGCDVFSTVLIVLFAFFLIYGGYGEAMAKFLRWETFGTAFDPPIPATEKPILLVIMLLVSFQAVSNLIVDWNNPPQVHGPDEVDEDEIAALKKTLGDID